ncbi:uncharacterized protein LOC120270791 [Dioscorea cayenensis subsp. rotundata]|uniref:Uncharacterized protein LOC120270791 n=1 Tax=Dioscorea cayennensis subsp. rotundata TaxID=55577 RepID=A0AB40C486_DIOCR|nr:uncharacterized protein LOC120270791 [Dioscorea cayenensis subsp. rotundata]
MEKIFPPSFFTIMVHLVIHLANEARLAGPIIYRWMYPVERFLLTLKTYVRNRASPEGSIAEGYLANECLTFASRYLVGTETSFNQSIRNEEDRNVAIDEEVSIFANVGRPLGRKKNKGFSSNKRKRVSRITLDNQTLVQAHRYVLFNSDVVAPFLRKHEQFIKRRNRSPRLSPYEIQKLQSETFHDWFHDHVTQLEQQGNANITDELRLLARGPMDTARRYTGYIVNGFRFHTKARERLLRTQNSGGCCYS